MIQSAWQLLETKWTVKLTFCCSEEDGKFSGCLCNSNANNNTTWKRFTVSSVIFSNGSHLVSLPFSLPSVTSHKSFYCFSYLRFNFFLLNFYLEKNPQTSEHDCGHPLIAADLVSFILHVKPVMLTVKFHVFWFCLMTRDIHPDGLPHAYTIILMFRLLPDSPTEAFDIWQVSTSDHKPETGITLDRKYLLCSYPLLCVCC